jgi:hypothetical protein
VGIEKTSSKGAGVFSIRGARVIKLLTWERERAIAELGPAE